MNTEIINIEKENSIADLIDWTLSFRPLIAYLKRRLKTEETMKKEFYRYLLEKLEKDGALVKNIDVNTLANHKDTLELIFTILTPLMANEKELFWALSTPIPGQIFFSTDLLYNFIQDNKTIETDLSKSNITNNHNKQLSFVYSMIMSKLYNFHTFSNNDLIFEHSNPESGLTQYFKVNVDNQFVDITYTKDELPKLNFDQFSGLEQDQKELELLQEILPLSDFKIDGFTVISITDISLQHSLNQITNLLVNHSYQPSSYDSVIHALKTLVGDVNMNFGLLPLITVNGKPMLEHNGDASCIMINSGKQLGMDSKLFFEKLQEYQKNPKPLFFNNLSSNDLKEQPYLAALVSNNIKSYGILPVFYNAQLVGLLEIFAKYEVVIDDKLLSKLLSAMPLLGQLFQYRIEEFATKMDEVIKDKFTTLQPSVQWKFNDLAWEYLNSSKENNTTQDIGTVTFKNLYPLYGAIDIRNSTIERNKALKEDLKVQLELLSDTLLKLKELVKLELLDKLLFDCKDWMKKTDKSLSSSDEYALNEFLEQDVYPILKHLKDTQASSKKLIDEYFECTLPATGIAFENRRKLEDVMQTINTAVGEYLESEQKKLQKTYPFYFAKFRSDGVEYDIYIGQEIVPEIPFDNTYLKNIRLWQLQAMINITVLTNKLACKMTNPLYTTQLIFLHTNSIDISFRNDERRFDVEGAYNIRYEIIKKRIDKVKVKGKNERLTQPGKIALVYYNSYEANEYITYIKYLQDQKLLLNDMEMLDLEDLQGVSGLKALRIGVNLN